MARIIGAAEPAATVIAALQGWKPNRPVLWPLAAMVLLLALFVAPAASLYRRRERARGTD